MRVRQTAPGRWRAVPSGTRDLTPPEAEARNALAAALRDEFGRWGYREVRTPVLEYLETIVRGAGPGVADQLFKVVDTDGTLLALRPEMTVPIARLAAARLLQPDGGPVRLAYVAEVFRGQEAGRGRLREFTQAGVELLGAGGPDADAEVIALAVQALRRVGVADALVHVGHLGFLDDLLSRLSDEDRDAVRNRLYRKDFVAIDQDVADPALGRLLRLLPELHGPAAISRARPFATTPRSRAALDELAEIAARVSDYGLAGAVSVDLSIIRDFSYYTGAVFEGYGAGSGYPLLGGGRYDGLLAGFGVDAPATGFALGLDRVMDVLPGPPERAPAVLVVTDAGTRRAAVTLAGQIRQAGIAAVLAPETSWEEAIARAEREGLAWVVQPDGTSVRAFSVPTRQERRMSPDAFVYALRPSAARIVEWTH